MIDPAASDASPAPPPVAEAPAAPPAPEPMPAVVETANALAQAAAPEPAVVTPAPQAAPVVQAAPPVAAAPGFRHRALAGSRIAARRLSSGVRRAALSGRATLKAAAGRSAPIHRPALIAAALIAATGLGYGGGRMAMGHAPDQGLSARLSDAVSGLRQSHDETVRLAGELKSLRTSVDGLKGERDRSRGEMTAKQTQLLDRSDKAASETTARLARLAEQLDRVEKAQRDPARINAVMERIDRLEKQLQVASASAPTPPPKPVAANAADVAQTGSLAEPKPARPTEPDMRRMPLEGFVLREIVDGMALVEGRNGRYFEVAPGMILPGAGKVEAIERRGRHWVVVTPKGYIGDR